MDIYEYLERDHDQISKCFYELEIEESETRRTKIFEKIVQLYTLHYISEKNTFYTLLRNIPHVLRKILYAEKNHNEMLFIIKKIIDYSGTDYNEVMRLKRIYERHLMENENQIIQEAKKIFTQNEACVLTEKMHKYKQNFIAK